MRSLILQRIAARLETDPEGARAELECELLAAEGPLVEPLGEGRALVTFVCTDRGTQPAVACQLFPGFIPSTPMEPLAGADIWWLEVETRDDISVPYQFQSEYLPVPEDGDKPFHHPDVLVPFVRRMYELGFADPHNPNRFAPMSFEPSPETGVMEPPPDKCDSLLTLPGAPPFSWHDATPESGVTSVESVTSKVLENTREVTIWMPPGNRMPDGRLPVVILLDGETLQQPSLDAPRIFDNLVVGGHTPPFVALLVSNATGLSRLDEYACDEQFADFVADELLPWARERCPIAAGPEEVVIGGYSLGGLASNWIALARPDAVGNVISMSASFWWGKRQEGGSSKATLGRDDTAQWLIERYVASGPVRARFWIDVGVLENEPIAFADGADQVTTSRRFREVLLAKGCEVVGYLEQPGGHDLFNWRRTLPQALIALLADRRPC